MIRSPLFAAAVLIVLPTTLAAQKSGTGRKVSQAAEAFTLDLGAMPQDDAVTVPDTPPAPSDVASRAAAPASSPLSPAQFTLDTPIEQLIADGRAKLVLDRDLPGLSDDENLGKFQGLSLRRFQPLTGGQLTDDMLAKVAAGLSAIGPASSQATTTGKGRNASR